MHESPYEYKTDDLIYVNFRTTGDSRTKAGKRDQSLCLYSVTTVGFDRHIKGTVMSKLSFYHHKSSNQS